MPDKVIDPAMPTAEDEQSLHARVISDNTPAWYTDALDARKTELAALNLRIPDWYKQASAPDRERMKEVHERSRRSLNQLDQMFCQLKSPTDYAEPLLVAEIEKTFGQRLDVRQLFYARKVEQPECNPSSEYVSPGKVSPLAPQFYLYKGLSLLEAALNNFTEDEAIPPVCPDCRLITRYDFHQYSASKQHFSARVRTLKLGIDAYVFATMCRKLDLGRSYFEHVRGALNAHISPQVTGAQSGKLYSTLITNHRNQLELAAEIALMKGDIQPPQHALIKAILINQTGQKWGDDDVSFSRFKLYAFELENILIIGPVVRQDYLVNSEILPRPCMVYIPGDPLHPLKTYDNVGAFTDQLTTRLCAVEYRQFFSQFIPISQQDGFYSKLKMLLDPDQAYTFDQDFDAAKKGKILTQGHYGKRWGDLWMDSALQRIRLIMANASASAVSTQDITERAYNAWLWSWGSKALDVLNVAAFVVPFLGEVMLVVCAVQMAYEVYEGLGALSDGDTGATWEHFSAVALNLAGLAVPKLLLAAKDTAIVRRLVHVQFGGRTRLYAFNPAHYRHQVTLPKDLKPDTSDLYAHEGRTYLPVEDGHYQVQATPTRNDFRLIHPDGDSRYAPSIRHNGEGAWVHEFERPLTWNRSKLLRRLGPRVEHLSDSQLEQIRLISGVSDDQLRRVYVDQQLPPPLFRDALRRFECAARYQAFIDRLSSADLQTFSRADWAQQMKVMMATGMWPTSRVLVVFDAEGNLVWRSAQVKTRAQVVKLDEPQIESSGLFPSLLNQLSESEIRHLLDEASLKRSMRWRLAMTGGLELDDTVLLRPASPEALETQAEQLVQAQRTPEARALQYRERLLKAAKQMRGKLINDEVVAGDLSSEPPVQLIQRRFPGLPKLVAQELVEHANSRELKYMEDTSRLPLRLAEEARGYLQKARIMRAYRSARRRVSASIKRAWQRETSQAHAADQTPIGYVLDLREEVIDELPALSANMDHVGHLVLQRMSLSDRSLPFLRSFGGLRWLNMRENNLTRLPEFANGGARLTKLDLSRNDIQLTEPTRVRLEAMQNLKILDLSDNRRLGWTANLRGMRSLNQLYLQDTGTTAFPAGAEQLPNLAMINMHTNRITTLPDYAYQHLDRINVHDNPLSAATLARIQGEGALNLAEWDDHVTMAQARQAWLRDVSPEVRTQRGELWDDVLAEPESISLFTVLADTTRSAEYASEVTRAALAERVWDMLEATRESQGIRETLFSTADDRVTCGDGSTVEFMNLERALIGARAAAQAGEANAEGALIGTARKLFRLHLVDALAQRDVNARGPGFTEQVEVILAYRIKLADRLGLPVKTRDMLFPHQANVSEAAIDAAYEQVLRDERVAADETAFFVDQDFWQKHLRTRYAQEIEASMAPARAQLTAKVDALEDLSEWQARQGDSADQEQWRAHRDELVDTLGRLLGKPRDEILVDGSMQSAFYVEQYAVLRVEQQALDKQVMGTLTRSVLNNFAAEQGTEI